MSWFFNFRRILSTILLPCFILSSFLAIEPLHLVLAEMPQITPAGQVLQWTVPARLGKVEEVFLGAQDRASESLPLILIQDAHINFDAQMSEAKLFQHFTNQYSYRTIFLEGVIESIDTRVLKEFPDKRKKRELTKRWMKKGILKGGEYFDINLNNQNVTYIGLENKKLYDANHDAFLNLYQLQTKAFKSQFNRVSSRLKNLKAKVYSKKLKEFDKRKARFSEGKLSLFDYLKYLASQSSGWEKLPALKTILSLRGSKDKLGEEGRKRLEDQLKILSANQVFEELFSFESSVADLLSESEKEKTLIQLSGRIDLLNKGLGMEFSRLEKEEFQKVLPLLFTDSLEEQFRALGVSLSFSPFIKWNEVLKAVLNFYDAAEKREVIFKERIIKEPASICLVGGYHTGGLTRFLREKEIPFVVVSPKIDHLRPKEDQKLYLKQLFAMKPKDTFVTEWIFESSASESKKEQIGREALKEMGVPEDEAENFIRKMLAPPQKMTIQEKLRLAIKRTNKIFKITGKDKLGDAVTKGLGLEAILKPEEIELLRKELLNNFIDKKGKHHTFILEKAGLKGISQEEMRGGIVELVRAHPEDFPILSRWITVITERATSKNWDPQNGIEIFLWRIYQGHGVKNYTEEIIEWFDLALPIINRINDEAEKRGFNFYLIPEFNILTRSMIHYQIDPKEIEKAYRLGKALLEEISSRRSASFSKTQQIPSFEFLQFFNESVYDPEFYNVERADSRITVVVDLDQTILNTEVDKEHKIQNITFRPNIMEMILRLMMDNAYKDEVKWVLWTQGNRPYVKHVDSYFPHLFTRFDLIITKENYEAYSPDFIARDPSNAPEGFYERNDRAIWPPKNLAILGYDILVDDNRDVLNQVNELGNPYGVVLVEPWEGNLENWPAADDVSEIEDGVRMLIDDALEKKSEGKSLGELGGEPDSLKLPDLNTISLVEAHDLGPRIAIDVERLADDQLLSAKEALLIYLDQININVNDRIPAINLRLWAALSAGIVELVERNIPIQELQEIRDKLIETLTLVHASAHSLSDLRARENIAKVLAIITLKEQGIMFSLPSRLERGLRQVYAAALNEDEAKSIYSLRQESVDNALQQIFQSFHEKIKLSIDDEERKQAYNRLATQIDEYGVFLRAQYAREQGIELSLPAVAGTESEERAPPEDEIFRAEGKSLGISPEEGIKRSLDYVKTVIPLDQMPKTAWFDYLIRTRYQEILNRGAGPGRGLEYDLRNPLEKEERLSGNDLVLLKVHKRAAKALPDLSGPVTVTPPFDPDGKYFKDFTPEQKIMMVRINEALYEITTNNRPILPHLFLMNRYTDSIEEIAKYPQVVNRELLRDMLTFHERSNSVIGFNSWEAGSSVNQFHVQGIYEKDIPFLGRIPIRDQFLEEKAVIGRVQIASLIDSFYQTGFVFSSVDRKNLLDVTSDFLSFIIKKNIPHNIAFLDGRIYVFLNNNSDNPVIRAGRAKIGIFEKLGLVSITSNEDYEKIWNNRGELEKYLAAVRLSPEEADQFLNEFIEKLNISGASLGEAAKPDELGMLTRDMVEETLPIFFDFKQKFLEIKKKFDEGLKIDPTEIDDLSASFNQMNSRIEKALFSDMGILDEKAGPGLFDVIVDPYRKFAELIKSLKASFAEEAKDREKILLTVEDFDLTLDFFEDLFDEFSLFLTVQVFEGLVDFKDSKSPEEKRLPVEKMEKMVEAIDPAAYEKVKEVLRNSENVYQDLLGSNIDGPQILTAFPFLIDTSYMESPGGTNVAVHALEVLKNLSFIELNDREGFNKNSAGWQVSEEVFGQYHQAFRELIQTPRDRELFYLYAILHNIGELEEHKDHPQKGAHMIRPIMHKLGLIRTPAKKRSKRLEWFIRHSLTVGNVYFGETNPNEFLSSAVVVPGSEVDDLLKMAGLFTLADYRSFREGAFISEDKSQFLLNFMDREDLRSIIRGFDEYRLMRFSSNRHGVLNQAKFQRVHGEMEDLKLTLGESGMDRFRDNLRDKIRIFNYAVFLFQAMPAKAMIKFLFLINQVVENVPVERIINFRTVSFTTVSDKASEVAPLVTQILKDVTYADLIDLKNKIKNHEDAIREIQKMGLDISFDDTKTEITFDNQALLEKAEGASLGAEERAGETLRSVLINHSEDINVIVSVRNVGDFGQLDFDYYVDLLAINPKNLLTLYISDELAGELPSELQQFIGKNLFIKTRKDKKLFEVINEAKAKYPQVAIVGTNGELFSQQLAAFDGLRLVTDKVMKDESLRSPDKSVRAIDYLATLAFGILAQGGELGFDSGLIKSGNTFYLDFYYIMSEMIQGWMEKFKASLEVARAA